MSKILRLFFSSPYVNVTLPLTINGHTHTLTGSAFQCARTINNVISTNYAYTLKSGIVKWLQVGLRPPGILVSPLTIFASIKNSKFSPIKITFFSEQKSCSRKFFLSKTFTTVWHPLPPNPSQKRQTILTNCLSLSKYGMYQ